MHLKIFYVYLILNSKLYISTKSFKIYEFTEKDVKTKKDNYEYMHGHIRIKKVNWAGRFDLAEA